MGQSTDHLELAAVTDVVDTAAIREAVERKPGVPGAVLILDLCAEVERLRAEVDRIPRIEDGWRKTNAECIKHWNRADAAEAELTVARDALDRVRFDAEEVLEHDTDDDPWFQGARAVARDVLDAITGPQPEDDQ